MAFLFYWQSCSIPPWVKDFSLTDSNRKTVTAKDLGKKPSAIFFGYTMSPDICPAMLASIENRVKELGPDADKRDFRFITVDPEQDTSEVLHDYLSKFTDKITGISGEPAKIHELVLSFNIGAKKGSQLSGRPSVIISEEKVPKISICSLYMFVVGRLKSLANNRSL
ncbi:MULTISPECIES: SCO family protein [Bartonella]|uniref:SCO family protein n=1 Tax=Bartonella TaxID=773 RepID=UPI0018DB7B26|nr:MULTISPECIES: SCO family protein [Bartonella]MBH9975796.1 SCO family protein [Bartonella choladocola]MBI0015403.1 SCO family protein [Bartonella sp. B10834G3]